uniref:Myosin-10-like isoform X4 n=1 Tax=Diabrotica virgifera virgifera TaxID=50390 RepID=A0A6P7FQY6_DIAVI
MVASVVFFLVILMGLINTEAVVTNEDIRGAILQLLSVARVTRDKLEKHEYADRVFGEQLKKALVTIDKRIKILDPIKGTAARLEDRLAAVETILMQTNEKEKLQLQMTFEAVTDIQKNLPLLMEEMKNEIISKILENEVSGVAVMNKIDKAIDTIGTIENEVSEVKLDTQQVKKLHNKSSDNLEKIKKHFSDSQQLLIKYDKKLSDYGVSGVAEAMKKIDKVTNVMGKIENEVSKVKTDSQQVRDLHNKLSDNLEKLKKHFGDSQQLLNKYDKKLADYNSTIGNKETEKWKLNVIKALDGQQSSVNDISQDLKNLHSQVKQLPQKDVINKLQNSIKNCQDPSLKQTLYKIEDKLNKRHDETTKNLNGLTQLTSTLNKNLDNTNNALDVQKSNTQEILSKIKSVQNQLRKLPQLDELSAGQKTAIHKLEDTLDNINGLTKNTDTLMKSLSNTKNAIDNQNKEIIRNIKQLQNKVDDLPLKDEVLRKLEQISTGSRSSVTLEDIKNAIREINNKKQNTNAAINCAPNGQQTDVQTMLSDVKDLQKKIDRLPQEFLDIHHNSLQLEKLSTDLSICKQQAKDDAQHILESIINNINKTHEDIAQRVDDLAGISVTLGESFKNNYDQIRNEIKGLNRLDQVMINTADGVIDTKQKVEFGVQQILAELSKSSNNVSNRLDTFETSILDPDTGALANVTSKVWRQMGIMYQQMSNNSDTLKQLQNQPDTYITGSLGTINNTKGKVGQKTGQITEVDENLNYLIGRLSLVTEDFNRIKTGLSSALEKIKESFHTVQEKVDEGLGSHNIDSSIDIDIDSSKVPTT